MARTNRLGRFEIIITNNPVPNIVTLNDSDVSENVSISVDVKKKSYWHVVWRGNGNLRVVTSSENLTSKRNAIKNIEAFPGVKQVKHTTDGRMLALIGRSNHDVVVIDRRS